MQPAASNHDWRMRCTSQQRRRRRRRCTPSSPGPLWSTIRPSPGVMRVAPRGRPRPARDRGAPGRSDPTCRCIRCVRRRVARAILSCVRGCSALRVAAPRCNSVFSSSRPPDCVRHVPPHRAIGNVIGGWDGKHAPSPLVLATGGRRWCATAAWMSIVRGTAPVSPATSPPTSPRNEIPAFTVEAPHLCSGTLAERCEEDMWVLCGRCKRGKVGGEESFS